MTAYYVYILKSCGDDKLYVGMASDVLERLERHSSGRVNSTKARQPLKLIYKEKVKNREEARIREKYWKSGSGREKLKRMNLG